VAFSAEHSYWQPWASTIIPNHMYSEGVG